MAQGLGSAEIAFLLHVQYEEQAAALEAALEAKHVEVLERAAQFAPIAEQLAAVREASSRWASR